MIHVVEEGAMMQQAARKLLIQVRPPSKPLTMMHVWLQQLNHMPFITAPSTSTEPIPPQTSDTTTAISTPEPPTSEPATSTSSSRKRPPPPSVPYTASTPTPPPASLIPDTTPSPQPPPAQNGPNAALIAGLAVLAVLVIVLPAYLILRRRRRHRLKHSKAPSSTPEPAMTAEQPAATPSSPSARFGNLFNRLSSAPKDHPPPSSILKSPSPPVYSSEAPQPDTHPVLDSSPIHELASSAPLPVELAADEPLLHGGARTADAACGTTSQDPSQEHAMSWAEIGPPTVSAVVGRDGEGEVGG
jgi:hypothetical protein